VAPLLALMVFIQYVDRGNIATAAPLMKTELRLSAAQIGVLVSAFYWTYMPAQPLAGWLAHRVNAYRSLALGLAIWSAATALTGLAGSFAVLIGLRLMLGLGESVAFPCSSRLLAQHLPATRLGAANGLIGVGLALGPAFGTWAGGNLMALTGWRASFLVLGAASILWLIPWRRATARLERAARETCDPPAPSFAQILRRREAWGASLGHFFGNACFYFVVSWLPLYLVQERGFSMTGMAAVGGAVYLVYAVSCMAAGTLTDRWIKAGASANRARKSVIIAACAVSGVALIAAAWGDTAVSIACLMAAAVGNGLFTPNLFAIGQTLAGPAAAGKWMGVQNGIGNIAGIVSPIVTGLVVDATGSFSAAFVIAGAASLLGILCWGVMIRKVAPLEWP
jgi:MFS family permease